MLSPQTWKYSAFRAGDSRALQLAGRKHSVFWAGVAREWVGFSIDLAAVDDGLLVGFLHSLAHVGLFVLHQLGLVQVWVHTQWLQLLPRQPLPAKHSVICQWLIVMGREKCKSLPLLVKHMVSTDLKVLGSNWCSHIILVLLVSECTLWSVLWCTSWLTAEKKRKRNLHKNDYDYPSRVSW